MIYTNYQNELEKIMTEIEDDIFDNLLEKYPELIDSVEEYTNGEIDNNELLEIVNEKFENIDRYAQTDMSEDDITKSELKKMN